MTPIFKKKEPTVDVAKTDPRFEGNDPLDSEEFDECSFHKPTGDDVVKFLDSGTAFDEFAERLDKHISGVRYRIEANGDKKIWPISSKRLLRELRKHKPVINKTFMIKSVNEGTDKQWTVEEFKK
jgi:hypothetical protein